MKKKILFLIPSLRGGGAEKVLVFLLSGLDKDKYDITLCVVSNKGIYFNEIPQHVRVVKVFNNDFFQRVLIFLHRKINLSFLLRWFIHKKVKAFFDVGFSFLDGVYADFLLALNQKVRKKVVVVHSSYKSYSNRFKYLKGGYKKRVFQRYKNFDSILFVSDDALQEFKEVVGEYNDMRVLHNPVDKDHVRSNAKAYDLHFDKAVINIVAVGSLIPVKSYDKLIEACHYLAEDGYNFKLRILGIGFLEDDLQQRIEENGLENKVRLIGFKKNPYPYMYESDIFVMTSIAEGLPTVLIEAMILGLPTIVTNCSGCRGVVKDGEFGCMVNQNSKDIYKGLTELINNSELRKLYKDKSLERAEDYDKKLSIKKYEDLIDELFKQN